MHTLAEHELDVVCEDDVVSVRRMVKAIARRRGFDAFATAAITTATSEVSRNTLEHGGGGRARIEELTDGARFGIRVVLSDQGPGIADVDQALAVGYSSARSLGLGLSGSKRLVDRFELYTEPGKGTQVTVEKWTRY